MGPAASALDTLLLDRAVALVAPGAVLLRDHGCLVLADPHVGTLAELQRRGYGLPDDADEQLRGRVARLLGRWPVTEVIVAGDLLHGVGALRALEAFRAVLAGRTLTVAPGNHDEGALEELRRAGICTERVVRRGPHAIAHGDDAALVKSARQDALAAGGRCLIGHLHPAWNLVTREGVVRKVPAFFSAPGLVGLPAFSPWAGGVELRGQLARRQLEGILAPEDPVGVAAVIGSRVTPVGLLARNERRAPVTTSRVPVRAKREDQR